MGNAATSQSFYHYTTLAAFVKTEVDGDTIKGDACCKDVSTQESTAATALLCAKAATAYSATAKHSNIVLAANDFFQSALAKCPHNTTTCTYAGLKKDGTSPITISAANERFINVEDQGSVVTLKMIGKIAADAGTAPALTQKLGDVCTWIIATKCDAPVITVGSTSATITTATP